jgi:hypothetical protein
VPVTSRPGARPAPVPYWCRSQTWIAAARIRLQHLRSYQVGHNEGYNAFVTQSGKGIPYLGDVLAARHKTTVGYVAVAGTREPDGCLLAQNCKYRINPIIRLSVTVGAQRSHLQDFLAPGAAPALRGLFLRGAHDDCVEVCPVPRWAGG